MKAVVDLFKKLQELVEQGYNIEIRANRISTSFPFSITIWKENYQCSRAFNLEDSKTIDVGIDEMIKCLESPEECGL